MDTHAAQLSSEPFHPKVPRTLHTFFLIWEEKKLWMLFPHKGNLVTCFPARARRTDRRTVQLLSFSGRDVGGGPFFASVMFRARDGEKQRQLITTGDKKARRGDKKIFRFSSPSLFAPFPSDRQRLLWTARRF